jgi:hypothetical protein
MPCGVCDPPISIELAVFQTAAPNVQYMRPGATAATANPMYAIPR